MGQRQQADYAAMEDVPIKLSKEESVLATGKILKDAAMEDVPITFNKEESALGTGQRKDANYAVMKDVPSRFNKEESA